MKNFSVTIMFDSLTISIAECVIETIFVNKQNITIVILNHKYILSSIYS